MEDGKMASNTSCTIPSTSNTENISIVSTSVSQNTSVTSLSLPETPSAQPTHKTKDALFVCYYRLLHHRLLNSKSKL